VPARDASGRFTSGIFNFDSLSPKLKVLLPRVDAAVSVAFEAAEARATTYARSNAPWTDQTGNARAGLFATHQAQPMVKHELVIYHTMSYGTWLELRWSGRYAIIGPTMLHTAPELATMVAAAVNRAVKGL
jgi:hypothetical protein